MKHIGFLSIIFTLLFNVTACGSHNEVSSERTELSEKEMSNLNELDSLIEEYTEKNDDYVNNTENSYLDNKASIKLYKTADTDHGGLVIKNDDSLWVWGSNGCGELGNGTKDEIYTPEKVMEGVKAVIEEGASASTLILKTDGSLWGCGYTGDGLLTVEATDERSVSVPVHIMDNVLDIEHDGSTYFVIKSDHSLWGWGRDPWGILGNDITGAGETQFEPVKILDDVAKISSDGWRLFIIRTDNSLWYCGNDSYGYKESPIVDGYTVSECITTPKKLADSVMEVDADGGTVYYITMDNKLYGWGCSPFYSNEPTYIVDDVAIAKAGYGFGGCNFIKTDGTLWYWQENLYYYTNDGWKEKWDGSELINPITDVVFCNSSYFPDFIKADGSLWAWHGDASRLVEDYSMFNEYGSLREPVQVMDNIKIQ